MPDDDEIVRRLQELADNERPMVVDFGEQPGPFELPKCGPSVSGYLLAGGETFALELETETRRQRLRIVLPSQALKPLSQLARLLHEQYGVGQTKN